MFDLCLEFLKSITVYDMVCVGMSVSNWCVSDGL